MFGSMVDRLLGSINCMPRCQQAVQLQTFHEQGIQFGGGRNGQGFWLVRSQSDGRFEACFSTSHWIETIQSRGLSPGQHSQQAFRHQSIKPERVQFQWFQCFGRFEFPGQQPQAQRAQKRQKGKGTSVPPACFSSSVQIPCAGQVSEGERMPFFS